MKYTIIQDTKEQLPWKFKKTDRCAGTIKKSLKTGDYTLEGYEDLLTLERKKSASEFYQNICSADSVRFKKELVRMQEFPHAFVILCFTIDELMGYPWKSDLPKSVKYRIGSKGDFFLRRFIELQINFPNIHFILCGNDAQKIVNSIFKRIVEKYEGK